MTAPPPVNSMLWRAVRPMHTNFEVWGTGWEIAFRIRMHNAWICCVSDCCWCRHSAGAFFSLLPVPWFTCCIVKTTCGATDIRTRAHGWTETESHTRQMQHEQCHTLCQWPRTREQMHVITNLCVCVCVCVCLIQSSKKSTWMRYTQKYTITLKAPEHRCENHCKTNENLKTSWLLKYN